jgi:hypothetical protein
VITTTAWHRYHSLPHATSSFSFIEKAVTLSSAKKIIYTLANIGDNLSRCILC